jgi:SAM-dependent methyltransferase
MDALPDDAAGRREYLERWVAEQQRRVTREPAWVPSPSRIKKPFTKRRRLVARGSQWLADHMLDRGLDTSAHTRQPEHDHPDRVGYVPSPWQAVPRALHYLGVSDRDTFIDFGCGKGRVVHQAAKRPFRRVIGVEISPVLAEIARTNLAARRRQHRCRNVEIVVSDVAEYSVPDDLTIGYLFHPVVNETLDALLRSIVDSIDRRPRPVRLIYVFPLQRSRVVATGRFRLLKEQRTRPLDPSWPPTAAEIFESL